MEVFPAVHFESSKSISYYKNGLEEPRFKPRSPSKSWLPVHVIQDWCC